MGANYGATVLPGHNASLEAPARLRLDHRHQLSDMLIRPIDLGWHAKQAGHHQGSTSIPTGRYEQGASDNIGKGMWMYEPFLGITVFFDEKRSISVATTAFWEIHGEKKDTNVKVGQILSLEGGLGKSFLGGGLIVGAAYYAQWKLTEDRLGQFVLPGGEEIEPELANKHQVFAFGPDVTLPIATRSKLFALANIRYLWEAGARSKTQGESLIVTATFPIPSVTLP
jgi:hypothetical protein